MNMTVIVGVDSSEASKAALRLAGLEARWRQASLVAVSAYELPLGPVGGFPGAAMHTQGEEQATAEAELRATVSQYVLLKARCPVTIVPDESTDEKTSSDS